MVSNSTDLILIFLNNSNSICHSTLEELLKKEASLVIVRNSECDVTTKEMLSYNYLEYLNLHSIPNICLRDILLIKAKDNPKAQYHLAYVWNSKNSTYDIDAVISNCCNNFGPGQFPEKLIPTLIFNILNNKPLPIYGKGLNSREWIFVEDHCKGLFKIFKKGKKGESYNIGTGMNINNLKLTKILLNIIKLNKIELGNKVKIKFVKDRPGHDFRYALNSNKIRKKLGWKPEDNFISALNKTFNWYYNNQNFFKTFSNDKFFRRLGLKL